MNLPTGLVIFWATFSLFPLIPVPALTLHEAQEILFKHNPDLSILQLEIDRSESQLQESKAAWLPSVDAIGNYAYTTETSHLKLTLPFPAPGGTTFDRALGDHDKLDLGLDATYPIFTGFTQGRNQQAKQEAVLSKKAIWQGARNQVSLKLAALYYAWQMSQLQTEYQEKILEHSQVLEKQLQDFVAAGTGIRSRALWAAAKSKAAEVELLSARNTRDSLGFELLDFLGSRDTTALKTSVDAEPDSNALERPDWELPGYISEAKAEHTETIALDHATAQTRYSRQALIGQKYPQLYGLAGYRFANPGMNMTDDAFMQYGIFGLQLKWNLFDGSRNRSQRQQLEIQGRVMQEQKRKLQSEWWKTEKQSQVQYSRWDLQFQAAKASKDAAEASAKDLKRQFEVGLATGLDWLEARNQAARAEMQMAQARTMQRLALLQWRFAAGKDLRY